MWKAIISILLLPLPTYAQLFNDPGPEYVNELDAWMDASHRLDTWLSRIDMVALVLLCSVLGIYLASLFAWLRQRRQSQRMIGVAPLIMGLPVLPLIALIIWLNFVHDRIYSIAWSRFWFAQIVVGFPLMLITISVILRRLILRGKSTRASGVSYIALIGQIILVVSFSIVIVFVEKTLDPGPYPYWPNR
ncbi:MAG: hypothetical protein G01um101431_89 [Parcubacteria group bacterium Gr01-1014_31]|nr:MAG: hypothetical protein G01um101431_89 [Parcubacteria group bacterium Gr01-1014_31]